MVRSDPKHGVYAEGRVLATDAETITTDSAVINGVESNLHWTEDGNSPFTATGQNSITCSIADQRDLLLIYVVITDQASSTNNTDVTVNGTSGGSSYRTMEEDGTVNGNLSTMNGLIRSGADVTSRIHLSAYQSFGDPQVALQDPMDFNAPVVGALDGGSYPITQISFDRGASTDWAIEIYGRDQPTP